eukprot:symbB.v1.2.017068.t1/scaffold1283.1/size126978/7
MASSSSSSHGSPKRRRLEVPSALQGLFARAEDPKAHGGRTRRVPHVEGNYPTLVFLPVKPTSTWMAMADAAVALLKRLGAGDASIVAQEGAGWHVSLSPLLMLRRQFIRPFEERLQKVVSALHVPESLQEQIWFNETWAIFSSAEEDRYFAGVSVSGASTRWLRALAEKLRGCAQEFGLQIPNHDLDTLQLHCSLAWTMETTLRLPKDPQESPFGCIWLMEDRLPKVPTLRVRALHLRVGDRTTVVPCLTGASDESEESDESDSQNKNGRWWADGW